MGWRQAALPLLTLWLLLTLLRQGLDLVGKLWVPVACNLIQLLFIIAGIFAVSQRRTGLLAVFGVGCALAVCYNTVLLVWWLGLLGDIDRPVLSAGLPYSHSFFLRYTPFCASHFDLQSSKWVQSRCVLPFHHVESAQCIIHALLAAVSLALAAGIWCERRRKVMSPKSLPPVHQYPSNLEYASRAVKSLQNSSLADLRSGYLNSSYDDGCGEPGGGRGVEGRSLAGKKRKPKSTRPPSDGFSTATTADLRGDSDGTATTDSYREVEREQRQRAASGRFRKGNARNRSTSHLNEEVSTSFSSSRPSTSHGHAPADSAPYPAMTSLVSFDPKSNTLIRVKEHYSDEDRSDYGSPISPGGVSERNVDQTFYESRVGGYSQVRKPIRSEPPPAIRSQQQQQPLYSDEGDYECVRRANPSTDSVPSMLAPEPQPYRSSFQLQPSRSASSVIGHYHAANEFSLVPSGARPAPLSHAPSSHTPSNYAHLNDNSLLV